MIGMTEVGSWMMSLEDLFYFGILNGSLAGLEINFFGRLNQVKLKKWHYISYIVMMYILYGLEIQIRASFLITTLMEIVALWIFGRYVLKQNWLYSAIGTVLAITSMQIINGIFQSINDLLIAHHMMWITPLLTMLGIIVIWKTYQCVLKAFNDRQPPMTKYVLILLLPTFFILLVIQYMIGVFGVTKGLGVSERPVVFEDLNILLIQIGAFFCLMAVIFAYIQLNKAFDLEMKNTLLKQQADVQKGYLEEIQRRYERTKAFRHDTRNHYTVLYELIHKGENESAVAYLKKLEVKTQEMSFPCKTGSTALDMLIGNKLGMAQEMGIEAECVIGEVSKITVDELDLCIIFANAIDNAIHACEKIEQGRKYIKVSGCKKGNFFMIQVENSQKARNNRFQFGTGLNNIQAVAEKYHGTMEVENLETYFRINILLIISLH